jgi:hypothetical protein
MGITFIRRALPIIISLVLLSYLLSCEKEETIGEGGKRTEKAKGITSIARLLEKRDRYKEKLVVVSGKATPGLAFEFVNEQPYLLDDGTGQIWVITTGTMPEKDRAITVKGKVFMPYQIKGRRYEIVILEMDRW